MTVNDCIWKQTMSGQPRVGSRSERRRTTSMRDVEMFTEMTGDRNPIHYDADLAAKSPFGGLIVQGGITTGLLNAVVAEDLPGPGTVFLETNWRFVKVEHVRGDKPICKLVTTVRNAAGEDCVLGTATTYTTPLLGRNHDAARYDNPMSAQEIGRPPVARSATARLTARWWSSPQRS